MWPESGGGGVKEDTYSFFGQLDDWLNCSRDREPETWRKLWGMHGDGVRSSSVLMCEASTGLPNGDGQERVECEHPVLNRYFNSRQRLGCENFENSSVIQEMRTEDLNSEKYKNSKDRHGLRIVF